jgi:hypothetical protein
MTGSFPRQTNFPGRPTSRARQPVTDANRVPAKPSNPIVYIACPRPTHHPGAAWPVGPRIMGQGRVRQRSRTGGGHRVHPARRPRRPLGGGDPRLDRHLGPAGRPVRDAGRRRRRPGPGRRRAARARHPRLQLPPAGLHGRLRRVARRPRHPHRAAPRGRLVANRGTACVSDRVTWPDGPWCR